MDDKESATNAEGSAMPAKEARKPLKKRVKVAPDIFLADWRDILASDADPVAKLRSMTRAGFQGDVHGEQVSQLVTSISEYRTVAERLALRLVVQERFGKLNKLSRRILGELRAAFENEINYDAAEFSGYRATLVLENWVSEHAPSAPDSERDSWFRRFTVCLLENPEPKIVVSGLVAASRRWATSNRVNSSAADAAFVRGITLALSSATIGASKLELILAGVDAVNEQFQSTLNRELDLGRQIRTQQDSMAALALRASGLEGNLADAVADGQKKTAHIAGLEQSLAEAEERYKLLDRHWRGVSEQELSKQSETLGEKVTQEVVEAVLALDRENPNLEIALRRLRRIQEILAK